MGVVFIVKYLKKFDYIRMIQCLNIVIEDC